MKLLFISSVLAAIATSSSIATAYDGAISSSVGSFSEQQADAIQKGKEKKVYSQFIMSHDEEVKKGKKGFFNKGKGEEDDSTEDNGKDDRKEDDDGAGIHSKHKADEGEEEDEKAFYGDSRFEMICNHEDDPKTSNGYFCKVLCGLCEEGNECCIAEHLGCDTSGWAVNDQGSFLRGEGDHRRRLQEPGDTKEEQDAPKCGGCGSGGLEESLDRLLTKVGLNK